MNILKILAGMAVIIPSFFMGAISVLVIGTDRVRQYFRRVPFNRDAWSDPVQVNRDYIRLRSYHDLLRRYPLRKMSRQEIIRLLGSGNEHPILLPDTTLLYWLGPAPTLSGMSCRWLEVDFDSNAKVSEYKILVMDTSVHER